MTHPTDALRLVPLETAQHAANNMRIAYHKTRMTREVPVSPDDLSVVLDFVKQAAPASPLPEGGGQCSGISGELSGWQDISTAPKDGTPILITRPTRFMSEEGYHVVRWDDDHWCCHDGKFDTWLRGPDPTHWMPLPAAPTGDA